MKHVTRSIAILSATIAASAGIALALGRDADDAGEQDGASQEVTVSIKYESTPQSVRDAFAQLAHGKTPSKVERITDEDVTKYEIEYPSGNGTSSATFSDHGHLLESETAIKLSGLPEAAMRELKKDYPGAKLGEAEAVQLFYYEVEVVKNGKTHDVIVLATGDIEGPVFGSGGDEDEGDHADEDDDEDDHEKDDDDEDDDDDD